MGCIYHHCSPFLASFDSCTNHKHSFTRPPRQGRTLWLKNTPKHQLVGLGGQGLLQDLPFRPPQALNNSSLFLSLNSPATSGDYSIFIPISAALFFVYWIANFVVPDIISKDFQSDSEEEQTPEKVNPMEHEKPNMKHLKRSGTRKSSKL